MPTSRGWAAFGTSGALLALWVAFGEIEMAATAVFLACAAALGLIFVRRALPRVDITRRIHPAQVYEGQEVTVEVRVVARGRGRNLSIVDQVHGLGAARFAVGALHPGRPLFARYQVLCRARGVFTIGPTEICAADPFAVAEHRALAGSTDRLVVYPAVESLTGYPAVRGLDPAVQSTRPTYAPFGGDDFFTLREYEMGDDLRKVHWPSSAKRDQLMIRQLEIPWQARALVLLDRRLGRYPDGASFEHAVRGAASAVAHLTQGGYSPELWTGDPAAGTRSDGRYTRAMQTLAAVQGAPDLDLVRTVSRLRRAGAGGGALVLVTGVPDEALLAAYRSLARAFARTVVLSVDAHSGDSLVALRRAGAITVSVDPTSPWAPAWRAAMELAWSSATAG
jgi:uncharacterized protein (DUF58 family)